jgi:hypothetical protein
MFYQQVDAVCPADADDVEALETLLFLLGGVVVVTSVKRNIKNKNINIQNQSSVFVQSSRLNKIICKKK